MNPFYLFTLLLIIPLILGAVDVDAVHFVSELNSTIRDRDHDLIAFEPIGRGAEKTYAMKLIQGLSHKGKNGELFISIASDKVQSPGIRLYGLVGLLLIRSPQYHSQKVKLMDEIGNESVNYGEAGVLIGKTRIRDILVKLENKDTLFRIGL
jgi:hypothetical protein